MRRSDREIVDAAAKIAVIDGCKVCRLGLVDGDRPYVVPLNFGYDYSGGVLTVYFHGAPEGTKLGIIARNPKACFEVDGDHRLLESEEPCKTGFAYRSVIGTGEITLLQGDAEKAAALQHIMRHQTGKAFPADTFPPEVLARIAAFKLTVHTLTGKQRVVPV